MLLSLIHGNLYGDTLEREPRTCFLALVPDGPRGGGLAPARTLPHIGVAEVEVGDDLVVGFEAEEVAHVWMVRDGSGAPDGGEAQRVSGKLHVLHGSCAGSVVLQRLHLIAAAPGDHRYNYRGAEGFLALAAYPPGGELLFFSLD